MNIGIFLDQFTTQELDLICYAINVHGDGQHPLAVQKTTLGGFKLSYVLTCLGEAKQSKVGDKLRQKVIPANGFDDIEAMEHFERMVESIGSKVDYVLDTMIILATRPSIESAPPVLLEIDRDPKKVPVTAFKVTYGEQVDRHETIFAATQNYTECCNHADDLDASVMIAPY